MTKHAKKSDHLQIVESQKALVEVPLPLLGALTSTRNAFFELCVDAGRQVLDVLMEQDREWLCGPLWKRDPERVAGRAGTTPSAVTLGGRRVRVDRPRVRNRKAKRSSSRASRSLRVAMPWMTERSKRSPSGCRPGSTGEASSVFPRALASRASRRVPSRVVLSR